MTLGGSATRGFGLRRSAASSTCSIESTRISLIDFRISSGMSRKSFSFLRGRMTIFAPARWAARILLFSPPIGRTRPRSVISPVIATSLRTGMFARALTIAVAIVIPADGPSFGIPPAGTWMWRVFFSKISRGMPSSRAWARELGIPREIFEKNTLHIHVPAGGTPKDGPSAGITMALAIVSALTGIPVRKDVAMTGEITLRGRVLPIGGLKSKILAAHLAGAKTVILPRKNEKDLRDIPEEIRKSIKLVLVDSMDQVLEAALRRKPKALVAEPPKIVKGTDQLDPEPEKQPTVRRSNFPPTDQPPV